MDKNDQLKADSKKLTIPIRSRKRIQKKEYDLLWEEDSDLINALLCLETKLSKMEKDMLTLYENSRIDQLSYEEKINDVEKRYDNKITVFMSAISIDCADAIDVKTKEINKNVLKLSKDFSKKESRLQKQLIEANKKLAFEKLASEKQINLNESLSPHPSSALNNSNSRSCSSSPTAVTKPHKFVFIEIW